MNKYLVKIAAIQQKQGDGLKHHQLRSIDKLMKNKGVILSHSTGSGKTRTILEAVKRIQEKDKTGHQLVITPASLTTNIEKEVKKHGLKLDMSRIETISYDKAVNDIDRLQDKKYSLVALDEAHKIRNTDTKRAKGIQHLLANADHRLLATATPIYNSPSDISPLVNAVAGGKILPTDRKDFEAKFISQKEYKPNLAAQMLLRRRPSVKVEIKDSKNLGCILNKYVDHYDIRKDPSSKNDFPEKIEEVHEVHMSPEQERIYKYLEGKVPFLLRMKIRHNLPLDKKESAQLNAFSTGIRQASNSTAPYIANGRHEISPKVQAAVEKLKECYKADKNFRGVVYSNYLKAGLGDYSMHLSHHGIKHSIYHGGLSKTEKDQAVKDYNSGKNPVLLVSSSGSEGLDLKGTKLIQVLEPHFNNAKINQVIGRGIRYKSHDHLPQKERTVTVQHFASKFGRGFFGDSKAKTIDQYLRANSQDKDVVTDKIKDLLEH